MESRSNRDVRSRRFGLLVIGLASLSLAQSPATKPAEAEGNAATDVALPRFPAISPDGGTIAFSWHGDLFTAPIAGGLATRLTTSPADDLFPVFSPSGSRLAFTSTRNGAGNLFTVAANGTGLTQVTFVDRPLVASQWSKDAAGNEKLLASGTLDPQPFSVSQLWEVSPAGGDLTRITPASGTTPCASPDGRRLLITRGESPWPRRGYRGSQNRDVWLYDRADKSFKRLTQFDGNDGKAKWADNDTVLFVSDRADNTYNLFSIKADAADRAARQLTHFKGQGVFDFDVAPGARAVVFSRWNKLYRLDLAADSGPVEIPLRVNEEAGERSRVQAVASTVSESALSPDGKTIAIASYGEVYVRGVDAKSVTRRVTTTLGGRKRDVAWSADGQRLLFVSDADGREEIYEAAVKLTRSDLRKRVTDAATRPAADGPGTTTAASGTAATQPATEPAVLPLQTPEGDAEQAARRPAPGGAAPTPTGTAATGTSPATAEPSRWAEALQFTVKRLFAATLADRNPTPSPDGRTLAFVRASATAGNELVLRDDATGRTRVLTRSAENISFRWSPDSRYVAYATEDRNNNSDIFLIPADGSEPAVNLTRHPNADTTPRFSADGKILAFLSNRTGTGDELAVYAVYLDKGLESLATPELDAYFRDAAAAARKREPATTRPTAGARTAATSRQASTTTATQRAAATTQPLPFKRADLEDAYLRIRRLTNLRGSVAGLELSPAGDRVYFNGYVGTTRSLLTQSRDATEPTRLANAVAIQTLSLAGDAMAVVDSGPPRTPGSAEAPSAGGRAAVVRLPGGDTEYYDPADRLEIDLQTQSTQKFLEAARIMGNEFYDARMNGVDWAANTRLYLPLAAAARTADEFDYVANRFIGELNASHLGISTPDAASPLTQRVGKLGIATRRDADARLEVTDVLPDGPADRGAMALQVGDRITAVNFEPIAQHVTLDERLSGTVGKEVIVSVTRQGKPLDLLLTPTTTEALNTLAYNRWRFEAAKKVDALSGGRIGYIHIQAMNQPSLETYKRDLFAACDGKDGLIIDVRWNGGGSTADLLLASIMSPYHAYTVPRGAETNTNSYPTDRLFIPRFIGPINMLCNERSFSNAEITAHAFKTLKRGTLIGNTTAGGVISTGQTTLLDGTTLRLPGRGWFTPDGKNMELNGATPDLVMLQSPEDEVAGSDHQLRAAVDDLAKRLK